VTLLYEIYVDTEALPGRSRAGDPPIIVRLVEEAADGSRVAVRRTMHRRVDISGPSAVVSRLDGESPHVWIEAADVTPQPPA
jgi:hypothetical protein